MYMYIYIYIYTYTVHIEREREIHQGWRQDGQRLLAAGLSRLDPSEEGAGRNSELPML